MNIKNDVYRSSQLSIKDLKEKFLISESEMPNLYRFLENNTEIIPVLFEAYQQVKLYFPEAEISLEVIADAEEDNCGFLYACILTELPVREAHQKLDDLDYQWYLNQPEEMQYLVTFGLMFSEESEEN